MWISVSLGVQVNLAVALCAGETSVRVMFSLPFHVWFTHSEGAILWWQNFTTSEGIEAGTCTHTAVSVKVMCALKWLPNMMVLFPHQSGIVGRVLVWSVWENCLSHSNKTVSGTIQGYFWWRVPCHPCGIPCLAWEPWQRQQRSPAWDHLLAWVLGTEGELPNEADCFNLLWDTVVGCPWTAASCYSFRKYPPAPLRSLQGTVCFCHLVPSFCSDLGICKAISHSLLPVSCFLSVLKHVFSQVPPPWLRGPAGPCGGWDRATGTGCVQHLAALASPHRGPCSHPTAPLMPICWVTLGWQYFDMRGAPLPSDQWESQPSGQGQGLFRQN